MGKACRKCGGVVRVNQPISEYRLRKEVVGIDNVFISVVGDCCEQCGNVENVSIPDLPGLIAAIARTRAKLPLKLSGSEIRFMRKAIEETAAQLAETLGVTPETVSRWENSKAPIGPSVEKLFRVHVGNKLKDKAPGVAFKTSSVLSMKIQALYDPAVFPIFHFVRAEMVPVDDEDQTDDVWKETRKTA